MAALFVVAEMDDLEKILESHLKEFDKRFKSYEGSPDVDQRGPCLVPKLQLPSLILEPFPSKDDYLKYSSSKNQFIEFSQCALDFEKAELDAVSRTLSSMKQKHEELQKDYEGLKKHLNELNKEHAHKRDTLADVTKSLKEVAITNIDATKSNLKNVEIRLDKIKSHAPVIYGLLEKLTGLQKQASHLQSFVLEKEKIIKTLDKQKADYLHKTTVYKDASMKAQENLQEVKNIRRSLAPATGKDLWSAQDVAVDECSKLMKNMKNVSHETLEDVKSPPEETPQLVSFDIEKISENIRDATY